MRKEYPGRYVIRSKWRSARSTQFRSTATDDIQEAVRTFGRFNDTEDEKHEIYDTQKKAALTLFEIEDTKLVMKSEEERKVRLEHAAQRINSDPEPED